jgi:type II secretory pathway component PulF
VKSRKNIHRGSSLVTLGFSAILFFITYGIGFYLISIILGQFFSQLNQTEITDPGWAAMSVEIQTTIQYIIPLAASIGIVIFVIKVLMASSTRGRD